MKIAILGFGVVGSGVVKVVEDNKELIDQAAGEPVEITHIFGRSFKNLHDANLDKIILTKDIQEIIDSGVEAVVEVLGGIEFPLELSKKFLENGIHVISANKDMLALHIDELSDLGNENKAQLSYEASSAGGVPIIQALNYGFNANKITQVQGILNGTTNYILTRMTDGGLTYKEALAEASEKGYAESDPTNDVDGYDAQRKITLLSRIAYKQKVDITEVAVKGIRDVHLKDIFRGKNAQLTLKLIGQSFIEEDGKTMSISVEPIFIRNDHPLASVDAEKNAVFVKGNAVGESMLYGPGAGSFETASAIVSDVINTAKFGFLGNDVPTETAVIEEGLPKQSYYIRFEEKFDTVYPVFEEKDIEAETISEKEGVVVITEKIEEENLEELKAQLTVRAIYPVY